MINIPEIMQGFESLGTEKLKKYLGTTIITKRLKTLDLLSKELNVSKKRILIISEKNTTRHGENLLGHYFYYSYCPEFNETLRYDTSCYVDFDKRTKSYRVLLEEDDDVCVPGEYASGLFMYIINWNTMELFVNTDCYFEDEDIIFTPYEKSVVVKIEDIVKQLENNIPGFDSDRSLVYLLEDDFFRFDVNIIHSIETIMPFLIFRCAPSNGHPRYLLYCVENKNTPIVTIKNESRATKRLIANFLNVPDSLRINKYIYI